MLIYGCRLSSFLIFRELKSGAYRKVLSQSSGGGKKMAFSLKTVLWIAVSLMYVMQTAPLFYRLSNGAKDNIFIWVGGFIAAAGIILESTADIQKNNQKMVRSDMVAMKGLYAIVRCPNYFGEILFWTGIFAVGFGALSGPGQWMIAGTGYALILYVMFDSARRLEDKQNKRYGEEQEYRSYTDRTPILIPFIPLYHLTSKP
jgi:steroid 5-alpha reductase family enzyme